MRMQRFIHLLLLGVLLTAGCSTVRPLGGRDSGGLAADPSLSTLNRAELLYAQGQYMDAVIEFRLVTDRAGDDWEREQARIGAAKSLIKLHRLPAAMAALGQLPVEPASETDANKLALAGEIYLRQRRFKEAEPCLELALDGGPLEAALAQLGRKSDKGDAKLAEATVKQASHRTVEQLPELNAAPELIPPGIVMDGPYGPDPTLPNAMPMEFAPDGAVGSWPSWMPACCANLGMAYLENDKPEQAAILYDFAAHLFRARGDHIASERAQRVSDDLQAVLRQYAPYKPPPLSRRLPPGKF